MEHTIDHEGLVAKYRAEKVKYEKQGKNPDQSPLLGDFFPHSLMVIESIHELLEMKDGNFYFNKQHKRWNDELRKVDEPLNL